MRLLASLFGNVSNADRIRFEESSAEIHATDAFLEALQMSHGDLANLLRSALRTEYPGERTYVWTRDVYDDSLVYEVNTEDQTHLFQRSYTVTDGSVSLGEPFAVIAVTQYVKADQATVALPATPITQLSSPAEAAETELTGDLVPLVEKAVKKDGTATIKIIAPGQGSSGFYPADVLKRDAAVFKTGTHVYLDHPSVSEESDRPERSVKDLVGSLTGPAVWQETGTDGAGLYAPVTFIDSVAPHINAIASISGMSIRAAGKSGTREIDGKKIRTIESIDLAHSVDVVTKPGAGGKVLDLIESARKQQPSHKEDDVSQEELAEANKKIAALEAREAEREARDRAAALVTEARGVIADALKDQRMSESTRTRIADRLSATPPIKEDALDRDALTESVKKAADEEIAYLAEHTSGNPVRGMGGGGPVNTETPKLEESQKRIETAIAAL